MGNPTLALPAPEGDGGADKQLQQAPPDPPPPPPGAKVDPPATVATHTRTIGIIRPPPCIRVIIEKLATFVAKNGPGFERRVISDNQGNANFSFLRPSDPYHAYYQHRVSETAAAPPSAGAEPDATPAEAPASATADGGAAPADGAAADSKAAHSADSAPFCLAPPPQVLVPPKAALYTVRLPEGITGEELDIIKLTSQFVARNGKNFLTSLAQRESNNMQFHFIRPLHSMFPFLTSLTEACPRVLKPEEGVPALIRELREGSKYMTSVLEGCLNRLEWELSREQARQQAEDEIEQEQMQMPLIDSHDFAVVETIEFADDEHEGLPVPPTREEFKRRKTMENLGEEEAMELAEPTGEVETGMDEEEMQLVEEEIRAAQFEENGGGEQVKVAGDDEAPMRIVKNYKRPEEMIPAERDPTEFVVSPITGEHIPISEMGGNMCISLIDPKYKKQKEMMLARIKEKTPAPDDEVSRNIVGLARTCPDVFRTTEEEVCNSVKAEIEKKKNEQPKQVIWDGRSGSIDWTATHGLSQPQGGEEQFDASSVDDGRPDPGPVPLVNVPRFIAPPAPYHVPAPGPHVPSVPQTLPHMHPPQQIPGHPLMIRMPGQMAHMPTSIPPPPGHTEFMPGPACSFAMPLPPHMLPMVTLNPIGIPWPPQPASEERPPLPDEPEHKRQRTDDASLIPAEQFLAHHPAETEKKRDEQPKQVIWDGDSGSIGQTATHASSPNQPQGGEEQFDLLSVYGRPVHGPAPLVQPGMPLPWPPQPPPLVNVPRFIALPAPYLVPPPGPRVPGVQIMPHMHPQQVPGQPLIIMMQSQMVHIPTGISPHPGHVQFMPGPPHPFDMPPPPHMLPMDNPIGIPQPPAPPLPPQPPEEQPPPPDEPEPKRQRIDDASLIPAEQFLAHHPGPASISVAVPNLDEGNLRGQVLQIPVQSLSDTIGGLKEHIAGELQLPANKQKLSLRTSFLKDNFTLAYYNVGPGVVILLTLKERGGRRKQVFPI